MNARFTSEEKVRIPSGARRTGALGILLVLGTHCGARPPSSATASAGAAASAAPAASRAPTEETHLADVRQLTFGGENAEAYWSWDGKELILQARTGDNDCDRIFRMPVPDVSLAASPAGAATVTPPPTPIAVSSGNGATTCSYFLPGDRTVIYASTHLGGATCPPKPDRSKGYTWALYDTYDIFKANADGTGVVRLTDTKGYDAEGTVCGKDGSIVFTSVRDGDIDLYRMDADGGNVKRLTNAPGYDGGAFFNRDCSKIVWRASRPSPGKELDDFRALLAQGLVRPSKLELYVANADGSDATQVTYLNAASFAPYWFPSQNRILFSSNYGDPRGREFDLWAINTDGTGLERITHAPGFDGFPMFSPDGKTLAFSSNRATPAGRHDTNVFLARWVDAGPPVERAPADRIASDIAWLADPAREGRGIGTQGLEASGAFIEARFRELGLVGAGDDGSFRQAFPVVTKLSASPETKVVLAGTEVNRDDFEVMGFSPAKADVTGDLVLAGYGISAPDLGIDDYKKLDVAGKVVLVRRFVPEGGKIATPLDQRRYGDIRSKAWTAKERGAKALIVVDDPAPPVHARADWKAPDEARLPVLAPEGYADAGIAVVVVKRAVGAPLARKLASKARAGARVVISLSSTSEKAFNVVGRVVAEPKTSSKLPGVIVVGAHYDHLGHGGHGSLAPGSTEPHLGADDNASGTSVMMEIAKSIAERKGELRRDVVFVGFSGEEAGVLGSAHFVRAAEEGKKGALSPKDVFAMLNLDMVGRMRENHLQVLGSETAREWSEIVQPACDSARVGCSLGGDGYGPSDQMSFYAAGVPVLFFFTGTHSDYHKPSDTADKINAAGAAQTGVIVQAITSTLSTRDANLHLESGTPADAHAAHGDMRSFNASLGTIPDYAGPGAGKKGVLLSGVRPGGAAEKGGMKRGDVLVRLGKHDITSVEDLMFVLNESKPGETVTAVVLRDGVEVKVPVTFQESHRPK